MLKLWTIAANSFIETIRQPIFFILLLVTFGVLVLDVPLAGWTMGSNYEISDNRMLVDLGLSTLMMSGLFIAAFAASEVMSREIEDRTVLTVVSKPVHRPVILLGKFLGVAAASTVAFYLTSLVFLLTVRHGVMSAVTDPYDTVVIYFGLGAFALAMLVAMFTNFFFNWQFTSTTVSLWLVLMTIAMLVVGWVGKQWQLIPFGQGISGQIVLVDVLLWMAMIVMTAVAVTASTRLGELATLGLCLGVFLLSLITDALFLPYARHNVLARLAYWAAPNLAFFYALDAVSTGRPIAHSYLPLVAGYAVLYTAALLLLGIALFETREMDAREGSSTAPGMVNLLAWAIRIGSVAVGIVGLSIVAGNLDMHNALLAVGCIAGAVVGWLLGGYLGAGIRWAFVLMLFVTAAQLIFSVVYFLFVRPEALPPDQRSGLIVASVGLSAYVLIMALKPVTREHFARRRHGPAYTA